MDNSTLIIAATILNTILTCLVLGNINRPPIYSKKIIRLLKEVLRKIDTPEPPPVEFKWTATNIFFHSHKIKIGGLITMVQTRVDHKFNVSWPAPTDKYGNATEVENVKFVSDDESIATIEADPDNGPYAAIVRTHDKTGATAVRIQADPKVGEEEGSIEGVLAVEVASGEAQGFGDPTTSTPVEDEDDN